MGIKKAINRDYLPVGTVIPVQVLDEHIQDSDPCNKDNCMLTRAIYGLFDKLGTKRPRVKSTNHGAIIDINGRRLVCVFDTKTATYIYTYDKTFRKTKSKDKALATVKPFLARLMVESNQLIPKFPPMTEEAKTKLKAYKGRVVRKPSVKAVGRDLSM